MKLKMKPQKRMDNLVNELIEDINFTFKNLIACKIIYEQGYSKFVNVNDRTLISERLKEGVKLEPLLAGHLKRFREEEPKFLYDVFHGRLIQVWKSFVFDVFELLLELHFEGRRRFEELGKRINVRFDFSSQEVPKEQIKNKIYHNFRHRTGSKTQIEVIDKTLNPQRDFKKERENILKNIFTRNAIKHRKRVVDSYILENLGYSEIEILDSKGDSKKYKEGDKINLSLPCINNLKSSILILGQKWKGGI